MRAMASNMSDKVVLITGGSSGIGKATALAFARDGAKVVIASRNLDRCRDTVAEIKDRGGEALAVKLDVACAPDVERTIQTIVDTYGHLDYAFNNAGTLGQMRPLAELTEADFDEVISVNLKGTWLCMKYEIQQMQRQGFGCIVNNSSISGVLATPDGSLYNASKHGILGLTKCAAVEYVKSGIRINAVCPGSFPTDMLQNFIAHDTSDEAGYKARQQLFESGIPAGRFGTLEEIADVVLWLCSDSSRFIVGQAIIVDGGTTLM
jgi:NAD(P)-dependent dehydrogenase (short-subunit alcohol dehydrogenase family)